MMDPRCPPINTRTATPSELLVLAESFEKGERQDAARALYEGRIAAGRGTAERQAVRLMCYLAGRLAPSEKHSRDYVPVEILKAGQAWCDQSSKVFMFLAWHLIGADGREIALKHANGVDGHTVIELEYNGAWHLFDAHRDHQAVYRSASDDHILSYDELMLDSLPVREEGHPWPVGRDGIDKTGFYAPGATATKHARTSEMIAFNLPWRCPWNCR